MTSERYWELYRARGDYFAEIGNDILKVLLWPRWLRRLYLVLLPIGLLVQAILILSLLMTEFIVVTCMAVWYIWTKED